jgi:phosphoglycolate phosphatase-like HAD superfamily hydrolase
MRQYICTVAFSLAAFPGFADPLPSWAASENKTAIIDFVESVTDPASPDYVTPDARIATFDNDGTLWSEQPLYFQFLFSFDQLRKMGAADPSILTSDTLKAAAKGDVETVVAGGKDALVEVLVAAHSGMSAETYRSNVLEWLTSATHPETNLPYDQMVYQPMLELLRYLRDEDFETYIVSGGGIDFMRVFAERVYGIPPENIVGSSFQASYQVNDGVPTLMKEGELFFYDDKEGKPVGIYRHIGRRPILAAGNSDGDFQMLEYTTAGDGARLGILVHHTDSDREFAYDREGHIGVLDRGLDEGPDRGWVIVDMARDWSQVWVSQ